MSDFKVGQRVWLIDEEKYATITKIEPLVERIIYYYNIQGNDFEGYWTFGISFHETADDMFKALGFEKSNPLAHIIQYRYENDGYITDICFNLSKQVYYAEGNGKKVIGLNRGEHLAIHQKMIELGWV